MKFFKGMVNYITGKDSEEIDNLQYYLKKIACDVSDIKDMQNERKEKIYNYRASLINERKEREMEQKLFLSVLDHIPDMIWAKKDTGEYIIANKAFREDFCYGMSWENLRGKTDLEISKIFKDKVGKENHTFGEVCVNSDEIILQTEKKRKFLEDGNIDGKLVKLLVYKSPIYNTEGVLFATCGYGRNVTLLHNSLSLALTSCKNCTNYEDKEGYDFLSNLFKEIDYAECYDDK